jgi:predicted ATP-dependent endonuclease of OLD family
MRLKRFRVIGFRSVADSGWVDVDDVTALVGENESGKTNILLPLWKLNPTSEDGEIDLVSDFPHDRYHEAYAMDEKDLPVFIQAEFDVQDLAEELATATTAPVEEVSTVRVERKYNGDHIITFPDAKGGDKIAGAELATALKLGQSKIAQSPTPKPAYEQARDSLVRVLSGEATRYENEPFLTVEQLTVVRKAIEDAGSSKISKTADIIKQQTAVVEATAALIARATKEHPNSNAKAIEQVKTHLPRFVYYSTYGNLDSEIYLPHVIDNMERLRGGKKLALRETAKARTLKVLFEFVRLSAQDILDLGAPAARNQNQQPTEAEIATAAKSTKERELLLSSASTELTVKFREWWKQGTHKFRFQADGEHFRIWVSDDRRPEEVELEARSSGLQWFFSFFLIFLVERSDEHKDAILLLDEPGLSLHPLAQRNLWARPFACVL